MPTTEMAGSNVPAFLSKLWRLVEDPKYDSLISWSPNGKNFIIYDQTQFAHELLPLYFKHNNMASFIRQLNMYGFRKVVNIDDGGLKGSGDHIQFFHNYFCRDQPDMLELIKRKVPTTQRGVSNGTENFVRNHELVQDILSDMGQLQNKQDSVDQALDAMRRENEVLWREVAQLRRKHTRQQQIVEKLIQFLVTLVQANRDLSGMKRKGPLMIHDAPTSNKIPRLRKSTADGAASAAQDQSTSASQVTFDNNDSPMAGPVIHDVTDLVDETMGAAPSVASSGGGGKTMPMVQSPASSTGGGMANPSTPDGNPMEPLFFDEDFTIEPVDQVQGTLVSVAPTNTAEVTLQSDNDNMLYNIPVENSATRTSSDLLSQVQTGNVDAILPDLDVFLSSTAPSKAANEKKKDKNNGNNDVLNTPTLTPEVRSGIGTKNSGSMQVAIHQRPSTSNSSPKLSFLSSKDHLNDHVEGVDSELDWLQEQLLNGGIQLDSNALLNGLGGYLDGANDGTSGSWSIADLGDAVAAYNAATCAAALPSTATRTAAKAAATSETALQSQQLQQLDAMRRSSDLSIFGSDDLTSDMSEEKDGDALMGGGNQLVQYSTPSLLELIDDDDEPELAVPVANTVAPSKGGKMRQR